MNKLEQLINELCPGGVEYKMIGEIARDIYRGAGIKRTEVTETGIPCVRYGEIYTSYGIWFDTCISHTHLENVPSPKYFEYGDILFAITGESVEDIAKSTAYIGHDRCLAGGDIVVLKHDQDPKYLSYALASTDARMQKSAGKVKSKVVHASVPSIQAIRIPIPPIEVQREIAQVLDTFSELTNTLSLALEAERTERKKQYEYYRDKLMAFDIATERKQLGELFDIVDYRGKTPAKTDRGVFLVTAKNIRKGYIDYETSKEYISLENYDEAMHRGTPKIGDLLFTTEAPCGNVALVDREDIALAQRVIKYRPKDSSLINTRYAKHYLLGTEFQKRLKKVSTGETVKGIKGSKLHQMDIPVPSIEVQLRIADVLDNFESFCTSINIELSSEIDARTKQYEYYRDLLLSFADSSQSVNVERERERESRGAARG